jgi:hypothetical protein
MQSCVLCHIYHHAAAVTQRILFGREIKDFKDIVDPSCTTPSIYLLSLTSLPF